MNTLESFQHHYDKLKSIKELTENDIIEFYQSVKELTEIIKRNRKVFMSLTSTLYKDIIDAYVQMNKFKNYKDKTYINDYIKQDIRGVELAIHIVIEELKMQENK